MMGSLQKNFSRGLISNEQRAVAIDFVEALSRPSVSGCICYRRLGLGTSND